MNAVEWKSHAWKRHGWKVALSVAVALVSGLLIFSVVLDLPTVEISAAFGGAPPASPLTRPDCTSIAPDGQVWHGVDIDLEDGAASAVRVGSASLSVERALRPGSRLRWHSDMGIDAVVVHGSSQSKVRRFEHERFDGERAQNAEENAERLTFCYDLELTVNADANPSLTRAYQWSVEESVEPAQWELRQGDSGVSTYRVSVRKDEGTERAWSVSGTITVDNLTPADVELEGVDHVIDGHIASQVDCGVDLDGYVLESGESLRCDYRSELPDDSRRTITARVRTKGRVRGAEDTSQIDFSRADVQEVGKSVYVTNSQGRAWTFHDSGDSVYERTFRCDQDAGLHPSAVRIVGTNQRSSTSVSVDCQPHQGNPTAARPEQP